MTDRSTDRFERGEMTEEEEATFLQNHPEWRLRIDLERLLDGEAQGPEAEAILEQLDCSTVFATLEQSLVLDALATDALAPVRLSRIRPEVRPDRRTRPLRARLRALTLAAVAGAVLLSLVPLSVEPPPLLSLEVVPGPTRAGATSRRAAAGDLLRVRVSKVKGHVELRIYTRDAGLYRRCPGDADCQSNDAELSTALKLGVGTYVVVRVASDGPMQPPSGDLDSDLEALEGLDVTLETVRVD